MDEADISQLLLRAETVYFPGTWPPREDLPKTLIASAGYHARSALIDYVRSDERHVDAAYHCGTAVEHLAKAYLASLHPVLIAERGDFDSLLILTGHDQHARKKWGSEIRTVGLVEACQRVRQTLPTFNPEPGVHVLANVRNAAAHLAVTRSEDIRRAVQVMVALTAPLLVGLGASHESYWGESADLASKLRDEALADLDRVVASKIEAARQLLGRRLRGLEGDAREAVLRAISGKPSWTQDYECPQRCPVCEQAGLLSCQFHIDEEDSRRHRTEDYARPHVYALSSAFYCSACELQLDDSEELRALGMPDEIDLGYLPLDEYGWPLTP